MGEEARSAIYALLKQQRLEWHTEERRTAEHFKATTRGGEWCMEQYGVPYNEVQGFASGAAAQRWCQRYGLNRYASFHLSAINPPAIAYELAKLWAEIMDYYYGLYLGMELDSYHYEETDHDCRPNNVDLREQIRALPGDARAHLRLIQLDAIRPSGVKREDIRV